MDNPIRIVCVSGGKDSTALYLWAIEQWAHNFYPVFSDTNHEHPVTLNYIRNLPLMAKGPEIKWLTADFSERLKKRGKESSGNAFLDLMVWKGRAPSTKAQYCTTELKLVPTKAYMQELQNGNERDVIIYTGIRAGESLRRSKLPERDFSEFYDCYQERPLLRWTESQVFEYLKTKDVPPNPLYAAGFSRVGCFPCIHARKSELASLPEWAWEKLAYWEKQVGRSWFPAGLVPGKFIPTIEDVRQWCTTSFGGYQQDMFAPDSKDVPSCVSTFAICE